MKFKYENDKKDYSDFASGRVLYNAPNTTAFPVRLGSEIMSRCLSLLQLDSNLSIYDPCSGGAHLLTAIGFLYREHIDVVYCTDIDENVIGYAKRNLSLLTTTGLLERKAQIRKDYDKFKKDSHLQALQSVHRLEGMNKKSQKTIRDLQCFTWDITGVNSPPFRGVNIIISDLPYGNIVHWKGSEENHVQQMLSNVYRTLDHMNSIVAIVSDKNQKISHEWFEKINRLKHGKRQITFLRPFRNL